MNAKKILIMGLPGAGKTTLARALLPRLNAVHLNADEMRANVHKDLGFTVEDRIEHARRLGWLADKIAGAGSYVIADFICPTVKTRAAFGDTFTIWVDRITAGRFADTNTMFEPPEHYDVRISAEGAPEYWVEQICAKLRPVFDMQRPTALFIGRYQPFHDGHKRLIEEGLKRVGQVCIAVSDTSGADQKRPFSFEYVRARIEDAWRTHRGRFAIVPLPNITALYHGRDVGYVIERIDLDTALQDISAPNIRRHIANT